MVKPDGEQVLNGLGGKANITIKLALVEQRHYTIEFWFYTENESAVFVRALPECAETIWRVLRFRARFGARSIQIRSKHLIL